MANGDTSMTTGIGAAPSTSGGTSSTTAASAAGTIAAPPPEESPVLVITVEEYETAITQEIEKYFETEASPSSITSTTIAPPKEENSSLTSNEMSALTDIASTAYSYVSPNKVTTSTSELEIASKSNSTWDSQQYQETYTNAVSSLQVEQSSAPTPTQSTTAINQLSALSVSIVEEPKLVVGTETTTSCYVDAEDVLEEETNFKTENLFTFDTMPTLPEDVKIQAETISLSLSSVLTKGLEGSTVNYQEASLPISSFDLSSTTNAIDTTLRTKTDNLETELQSLPIQMKSLFLGRSPSVTNNWVDAFADPMSDPTTSGMMQYNYCEIQEVQILSSYSTTNPTFTTLTKSNLDSIKGTGKSLICRLRPYDISGLVPDSRRTTNTNTTNEYFVIKDSSPQGRQPRSKSGPVCGTTGFANSIMQYLNSLTTNMNEKQRDAMKFVNIDNNETVEPLFNQSDQYFAAPLVGLGGFLNSQQAQNSQPIIDDLTIENYENDAADTVAESDNAGFCSAEVIDPTSLNILGDIEDALATALEDFTEETEQSEEDQEEAVDRGSDAAMQDMAYRESEEDVIRLGYAQEQDLEQEDEETVQSGAPLGGSYSKFY